MHRLFLSVALLLISFKGYTQSIFDKELSSLSLQIADKLKTLEKTRVVVLYITDVNKRQTIFGNYMADAISVNVINTPGLQVFERSNLDAIAEAKRLISEGYIDAARARQLGQLLSVKAIIVGNYAVRDNSVRLTLKALDVSDGFAIASSYKDLPIDADVAALLGINSSSSNGTLNNRGFNAPISTNEQDNSPTTVSSDCQRLHSGDFCFYNGSKHDLTVRVIYNYIPTNWNYPNYTNGNATFLIKQGESKCVYGILSGSGRDPNSFEATYEDHSLAKGPYAFGQEVGIVTVDKGNFVVEQCKSKTYNIR